MANSALVTGYVTANNLRIIELSIAAPAASDWVPLGRMKENLTVLEVDGHVIGGTSAAFNIEYRTTPGAAGTNVMTADMTATTSNVNDSAPANPSLAIDKFLGIDISAVTGSVTFLNITIKCRLT